jgi:hypothetical protein
MSTNLFITYDPNIRYPLACYACKVLVLSGAMYSCTTSDHDLDGSRINKFAPLPQEITNHCHSGSGAYMIVTCEKCGFEIKELIDSDPGRFLFTGCSTDKYGLLTTAYKCTRVDRFKKTKRAAP